MLTKGKTTFWDIGWVDKCKYWQNHIRKFRELPKEKKKLHLSWTRMINKRKMVGKSVWGKERLKSPKVRRNPCSKNWKQTTDWLLFSHEDINRSGKRHRQDSKCEATLDNLAGPCLRTGKRVACACHGKVLFSQKAVYSSKSRPIATLDGIFLPWTLNGCRTSKNSSAYV